MSSPALSVKLPTWQTQLSMKNFVNWVAISNDASRLIADTYYYPYPGTDTTEVHGTYGTYCFDSTGALLWSDEFEGDEGVFAVAISGDGQVAAAGGLFSGGKYSDDPDKGFFRAYNANTGARLIDYGGIKKRVNSVSLSDDGGVIAAVAASKLYVWVRKNGVFPADPAIPVTGGDFLDCASVHSTGDFVTACDRAGNVYMVTIKNGAVDKTFTWTAPVKLPFLSVAASTDSSAFVVGGGNFVYLFTKQSMKATPPAPIAFFSIDGKPPNRFAQTVRWVGISGNGLLASVVSNRADKGEVRAL